MDGRHPLTAAPSPHEEPLLQKHRKRRKPLTSAGQGFPGVTEVKSGGVLLSHKVPLAVPSALRGLASGFGM
jgi:hypothetical protein